MKRLLCSTWVAVLCWTISAPVGAQGYAPHALRLVAGPGANLRAGDKAGRFGAGAGLRYEYRFLPWLGAQAGVAAFYFPYDKDKYAGAGYADYRNGQLGVVLHPLPQLGWADLWLSGAAGVVATGSLWRPGVTAELGLDLAVVDKLSFGPMLAYAHVFQPNGDARGGQDGHVLQLCAVVSLQLGRTAALRVTPDEQRAATLTPSHELDDADGVGANDAECSGQDDCPGQDADADGVPNARDACPEQAEDLDQFQDDDGCPEPDNDRDGVDDAQDMCPLQAGAPPRGCPEAEPEELPQRLMFAANQATLSPQALEQLQRVLAELRARPDSRVRVVGHADERGSDEYNQALSERRAQAAAHWLAQHGVSTDRVDVVGMGERVPLDLGHDEAAHARNRRVSFELLAGAGRPRAAD